MFAVVVTFHIKRDLIEAFLPLIVANAATSLREESGCQRFDVWSDDASSDVVHLYEIYDDAAAFERHKTTEHFNDFDEATTKMIVAKDVKTFNKLISA